MKTSASSAARVELLEQVDLGIDESLQAVLVETAGALKPIGALLRANSRLNPRDSTTRNRLPCRIRKIIKVKSMPDGDSQLPFAAWMKIRQLPSEVASTCAMNQAGGLSA